MDPEKLTKLVRKMRQLEYQIGEGEDSISLKFLRKIRTNLEGSSSQSTNINNLEDLTSVTQFPEAAGLTAGQEKLFFAIKDLAEKLLKKEYRG